MAINTNKLKTFAQNSRDILIEGVSQRIAFWGFNNNGEVVEEPQKVQGGILHRGKIYDNPGWYEMYSRLKYAIRKKGVVQVAEEAAYTWFNRIMAIRILSKNRYIQPQVEFGEGGVTPLILQYARRGQVNFLNNNEKERLNAIITDYQKENEAFAILLISFCNNNTLLRNIFGTLDDFSELLLPANILAENGFVHLLNKTDAITDEDYRQVELIGWLYQFYISKKKDEVFKKFKNNKKAEKEDIPAATQIFTPNWIVKYMVQNTVGQIWLDLHPLSPLKEKMKYRVEPAEGNPSSEPIIKEAADLKILDPASGSGHILVEAFDLLFEMYKEEYYTDQDAVLTILEKNIYGLDIDRRAVQLGQFAVLLKAAAKWPGILDKGILPMVYAMPEPYDFTRQEVLDFLGTNGTKHEEKLSAALRLMQDAQNLGSVMIFDLPDAVITYIKNRYNELENKTRSFNEEIAYLNLHPFLNIILVLTQRYPATSTNPPYMGQKNMNAGLKNYINANYPLSKSDLFAVFMDSCLNLTTKNGLMGMINQHSWMFLSSYEDLREKLLANYCIVSMLHLGPRTFEELNGEVVQSTAFTLKVSTENIIGTYHRLVNYKNNEIKNDAFISRKNIHSNIPQSIFQKIKGSPIVYWGSDILFWLLENETPLSDKVNIRSGISTGDNDLYYRYWFEVDRNKIEWDANEEIVKNNTLISNNKWFFTIKGGENRKWFGNRESILNLEKNGAEIRESGKNFRLRTPDFYHKVGITWSRISTDNIAFRIKTKETNFGENSPCFFLEDKKSFEFYLGLLNSKLVFYILSCINPTLTFQVIDVAKVPIKSFDETYKYNISKLVNSAIDVAKDDWNSMETSWDYIKTQLLDKKTLLKGSYIYWQNKTAIDFFNLHSDEEDLNNIFIEIYGLQDELTPNVAFKDITILQEELNRDALDQNQEVLLDGYKKWKEDGEIKPITDYVQLPIKKDVVMQQLISYAIGTMMGRYRLDKPGLQIAHPNPTKEEVCTYQYNDKDYEIDKDGIIPLMGSGCTFTDDAYNRMKYFIEVVWGEETLTENINFLEECLDASLEKYLVKDFWGNHCRMYSKRPVYWLFSSKKGAFQVLVYMHRMNRFTCEKIRSNYLLKHIQNINNQILSMSQDTSSLSRAELKKLEQLKKDLEECNEYDLYLKDIADKQIEFDLDDGVVENYKLFKGVLAPIK